MLNVLEEIKEKMRNEFLKENFVEGEKILKENFEILADDEDMKIVLYTVLLLNESDEIVAHQYIYRKFENQCDELELEHNRVLLDKHDLRCISLSHYSRDIRDFTEVKISNLKIENRSDDSNYKDIKIIIDNEGKIPVQYIKVNLYYKDESGKIVKSEWTNDGSIIQPGASQVLYKMTEMNGWQDVQAEIAEIH